MDLSNPSPIAHTKSKNLPAKLKENGNAMGLKGEAFQRRMLTSRVGVAEFFSRKISVTGQTTKLVSSGRLSAFGGESTRVTTLVERSNLFQVSRHAERAH